MIEAVTRSLDRVMGRGEAAITVPPMDGPLKPNRLIEDAEVVAQFAAPEDMAWDGQALWVADGAKLLCQSASGAWAEAFNFDRPITAVTYSPLLGVVAAVGGDDIRVSKRGAWKEGKRQIAGRAVRCVTALSAAQDGSLIVTEGSSAYANAEWSHDLMSLGRTGRVCRVTPDANGDIELATNLRHAFGGIEQANRVWISESWGHRVVAVDGSRRASGRAAVVDRLPAYPSRMARAQGGGAWLTLFAARTRLIEFVLREPEYRRRMMADVDPRYWVAPALSSGSSFLEPLQGGSVKQLGIMKPWAPPRSYGLVVRLDASGLPMFSLHSRADGRHHGIVAACEADGYLYMLSKGSGRLLRVALESLHSEEER
jgi:hypothetical protein